MAPSVLTHVSGVHVGPGGTEFPIMVAGHCLAPFDLGSFGLGSLPGAAGHCLAPCDPVSDTGESLGPESLPASLVPSTLTSSLSRHAAL